MSHLNEIVGVEPRMLNAYNLSGISSYTIPLAVLSPPTIITWISRRSVENHGIHSSELLFYNHDSRLVTWSSILWFLMTLFILCILSFILLIVDKSLLCYWIVDWYSLQFSHSCLYCLLIHYISFHDILWYSMDYPLYRRTSTYIHIWTTSISSRVFVLVKITVLSPVLPPSLIRLQPI